MEFTQKFELFSMNSVAFFYGLKVNCAEKNGNIKARMPWSRLGSMPAGKDESWFEMPAAVSLVEKN